MIPEYSGGTTAQLTPHAYSRNREFAFGPASRGRPHGRVSRWTPSRTTPWRCGLSPKSAHSLTKPKRSGPNVAAYSFSTTTSGNPAVRQPGKHPTGCFFQVRAFAEGAFDFEPRERETPPIAVPRLRRQFLIRAEHAPSIQGTRKKFGTVRDRQGGKSSRRSQE